MSNKHLSQRPIIFMGGGGHASVLADVLLRQGRNIIAIFSPEKIEFRNALVDIATYHDDERLGEFDHTAVVLVNAIGKLPYSRLREKLAFSRFTQNFLFESVISESAYVSPNAAVGEGVQIMPGAIVQSGAVVGDHSIINSNAVVEHDCVIGKFNHIAPSATLCGHVETGYDVHIGAGATVMQGVSIGQNSVIGASTYTDKNVPDGMVVKANHVNEIQGRR